MAQGTNETTGPLKKKPSTIRREAHMDSESTDTKMETSVDLATSTAMESGSETTLTPLPTKEEVRAEIISLHKSASDWEMAGMTVLASANRRTAIMLARLYAEIVTLTDQAGVE